MDQTTLAPAAPAAMLAGAGLDIAPIAVMLPALGAGALAGGLTIGGEAAVEGPVGLSDRTPWLAMAVASVPPAPRVGAATPEGGKKRSWETVGRRAGPARREGRPGEECSAGVCICGLCHAGPRRP